MREAGRRSFGTGAIVGIGLAFLGIIAAIWILVLQHVRHEREIALALAARDNENIAIALEQYVARVLEAQDLAAIHVAERFKTLTTAESPGLRPRALVDPIASDPLIAGVLVTDAEGNVRFTTLPRAGPLNVASRPAFAFLRAADRGEPVISKPALSPLGGKPLFSLTRAIRRPDGSFGGTVVVQIEVSRLTAFADRARTSAGAAIGIVRRDGIVLARRAGAKVSFGEDLRNAPVVLEQRERPFGNYRGKDHLDGVARLYSHRRLTDYPLFVYAGVAEGEALRSVERNRSWYLLAAGALTVALMILASVIVLGFRRREQAAAALSTANERLAMAQRLGRIGDWIYDPGTGGMIWSENLCEMYQRPGDAAAMSLDEALASYPAEEGDRFREALARAVATGEPGQIDCTSMADPNAPSARRIRFWPLSDDDGSVRAVTGTDQDITKDRLNERLRNEVAHNSRIESMNLMAATLAHELAQPLTAATNYLAAACRHAERSAAGEAGNSAAEALRESEKQLAVAREIVRGAREMLSRGGNRVERPRMAEVVEDAIALMKAAESLPDVELSVTGVDPDLAVMASKVQAQQVIMNLLRNSAQALAGRPSPRIAIAARAMGAYGLVCVEDNGPGIPEALDGAFRPFAESDRGGLGLGLSICKVIVESYGGSIWVDRRVEVGSRICFTLPLSDQRPN